mmetsp:Transcript_102431/g.330447  ORF Transcript_102431/g.330447 Transcript_102431/m.330447 type:complete len:213 (-) Transcript_102431:1483-2121(-)
MAEAALHEEELRPCSQAAHRGVFLEGNGLLHLCEVIAHPLAQALRGHVGVVLPEVHVLLGLLPREHRVHGVHHHLRVPRVHLDGAGENARRAAELADDHGAPHVQRVCAAEHEGVHVQAIVDGGVEEDVGSLEHPEPAIDTEIAFSNDHQRLALAEGPVRLVRHALQLLHELAVRAVVDPAGQHVLQQRDVGHVLRALRQQPLEGSELQDHA